MQDPLSMCAHMHTACHGVSTSPLTQCTHLQSCMCVHHTAYLAMHTHVQVHVYSVLACQQACLCLLVNVHPLGARAKQTPCAGTLGLMPPGS